MVVKGAGANLGCSLNIANVAIVRHYILTSEKAPTLLAQMSGMRRLTLYGHLLEARTLKR
jgi:hypothetical protein